MKPFALCIIAAVIFWIFNALNHDYTADLNYPVKIVYDESKLIPSSPILTNVEINATGYGWNILTKSFFPNKKPVFIKPVDLPRKNHVTSFEIFPLFADQLKDIKINYFLKDTIHLDFDYLISKNILVRVDKRNISLGSQQRIAGEISVQPDVIKVTGASKIIRALSDTLFLKVPPEEVGETFEEVITIDNFNHLPVKVNTDEVSIKFTTKVFNVYTKNLKITKINFPKSTKSETDSVTVKLYYESLGPGPLTVEADYRNKKNNKVFLHLIQSPQGVSEYELHPEFVVVKRKVSEKGTH